ncbi:unnamed protein product [Mucor hiemalis]
MMHHGKMNAYLAVESGSEEIEADLRRSRKGKGRAIDEQDNERKTRLGTMSPKPAEEVENETSFITISSGGTYEENEGEVVEKSPILTFVNSFDELRLIREEDLINLSYMSSDISFTDRLYVKINHHCIIVSSLYSNGSSVYVVFQG